MTSGLRILHAPGSRNDPPRIAGSAEDVADAESAAWNRAPYFLFFPAAGLGRKEGLKFITSLAANSAQSIGKSP